MGGPYGPPSVYRPVLYIQGCPFIQNITTLCTSRKCITFYPVSNNFADVSTIAFWWRHRGRKPIKMTFGIMQWRQVYGIWPNLPKVLILLISKWHTSILTFRWVFVPFLRNFLLPILRKLPIHLRQTRCKIWTAALPDLIFSLKCA